MGDHVVLDVVSPVSSVGAVDCNNQATPSRSHQIVDRFGSRLSLLPQIVRGFGSRLSFSIRNEDTVESGLSNPSQTLEAFASAGLPPDQNMDDASEVRKKGAPSLPPIDDSMEKADTSKTPPCIAKNSCDVIQYGDPFSASKRANTSREGFLECRICQDEDDKENLEVPCACSGSLKYAHRKCVQRWCDEKGNTICEICQQAYKSGYTVPDRAAIPESSPIELRYSISNGHWRVESANQLELQDPRVMTILEAEYGDLSRASVNGAACIRSAALILLALLLLRHGLELASPTLDDDPFTVFIVFFIKAVGFILPCYIMARAVNMLQRRRRQQEASLVAAEVSILLRAAQERRMQLTIAPGPFAEHT